MPDSIVAVEMGLQATRDVAAANMLTIPVNEPPNQTFDRGRETTKIEIGTIVKAYSTLKTGEYDTIAIQSDLWYDWPVIPIAGALGLPTTTNHAGATGVKDHSMQEGTSPPLLTVNVKDQNGVWWQMLNCVTDVWKVTIPNVKKAIQDFTIHGDPATIMGSHTDAPVTIAACNHPIPWAAFLTKLNGVDYADVKSASITVKRGRKPLHTGNRSTKPRRFTQDDAVIDFEVTPDYSSDTGSLFKKWRDNEIPGPLEFEWVDEDTEWGTGTPTNPLFSIKIERPLLEKGQRPLKGASGETPISGTAAYSIAAGRALRALFTNLTAAYTPS